jgi:hypothetical protein
LDCDVGGISETVWKRSRVFVLIILLHFYEKGFYSIICPNRAICCLSERDNFENSSKLLDRDKIDKVGFLHNKALKYILENTTEIPSKGEMINHVYLLTGTILPEEYAAFKAQGLKSGSNFDHLLIENKQIDYKKYILGLKISEKLKGLLNEMTDVVLSNSSLTETIRKINKLEERSTGSLSNAEALVFLSSASVARHSAEFWYPVERGGEGGIKYLNVAKKQSFDDYGDDPYEETDPEAEERRIFNWGKVILADAIGCASAATTSVLASGGTSAIPNPLLGGIPTAGAIGAVAGVAASANNALGQW